MAVDILGMYGSIVGTLQNAIAALDIPQDGVLIGIDWDLAVRAAIVTQVEAELSFIATNQLTTNDVRGRISTISINSELITAVGVSVASAQKWIGGFDLPLSGGERIFIHVNSALNTVGHVRCNLYYDSSGTMRRSARRR